MIELTADPKQAAILNSAFQAFANYGFRKTSMDDIAKGAGMSRPAVYLHYKNKEAIVRELTQHYYTQKVADVAVALKGSGSVSEILKQAIRAQTEGIATVLASPHGVEMLDATKSMSTDIVENGEAELARLYATWLAKEDAAGRVRLFGGPDEVATTITRSLKGLKLTATHGDDYENRVSRLADLIGAGLQVR
ncbi:MAG: TetR/AcrR family transcriptional regulator [Pseudomonadota bacterium]